MNLNSTLIPSTNLKRPEEDNQPIQQEQNESYLGRQITVATKTKQIGLTQEERIKEFHNLMISLGWGRVSVGIGLIVGTIFGVSQYRSISELGISNYSSIFRIKSFKEKIADIFFAIIYGALMGFGTTCISMITPTVIVMNIGEKAIEEDIREENKRKGNKYAQDCIEYTGKYNQWLIDRSRRGSSFYDSEPRRPSYPI